MIFKEMEQLKLFIYETVNFHNDCYALQIFTMTLAIIVRTFMLDLHLEWDIFVQNCQDLPFRTRFLLRQIPIAFFP